MNRNSEKVIRLPENCRDWRIRVKVVQPEMTYLEANPAGDHPNDPTEILAITRTPADGSSVARLCDHVIHLVSQRDGAGEFSLHSREPCDNGELFHWSIRNDLIEADRSEIQRIFEVDGFRFNIVYTQLATSMTARQVADWNAIIRSVRAEPGSFLNDEFQLVAHGGPAECAALRRLIARPSAEKVDARPMYQQLSAALSASFAHDDPMSWVVGQAYASVFAAKIAGESEDATTHDMRVAAIRHSRLAASLARRLQHAELYVKMLSLLCDALSVSSGDSRALNLLNCASGYQIVLASIDAEDSASIAEITTRWLCVLLCLKQLAVESADEVSAAARNVIEHVRLFAPTSTPIVLQTLDEYGALCVRRGMTEHVDYFRQALEIFDVMEELSRTLPFPGHATRMDFLPLAVAGQRESLLGLAGLDPALVQSKQVAEFSGFASCAYLRPLDSSRRVLMTNGFHRFDRPDLAQSDETIAAAKARGQLSLEAALHVNLMGWLVSNTISGPTEGIGMARGWILPAKWYESKEARRSEDDFRAVDDDGEEIWKEAARVLFGLCRFFFVLASPTDGVAWEVAELRTRKLLSRASIIMIPEDYESDAKETWEACRERYRSLDVHLPPYSPEGAFVVLNNEGHVDQQLPFDAIWDGRLKSHMQRIIVGDFESELAEARHDRAATAETQMQLSTVLRAAGRYDEALRARQLAVDFYRSQPDKMSYARALANLAYLQQVMGGTSPAIQNYELAARLIDEHGEPGERDIVAEITARLQKLTSAGREGQS